jgi:hypothetical protein
MDNEFDNQNQATGPASGDEQEENGENVEEDTGGAAIDIAEDASHSPFKHKFNLTGSASSSVKKKGSSKKSIKKGS